MSGWSWVQFPVWPSFLFNKNSPTLLKLKVKIETTDMVEKNSVMSLRDCGATGEFIDRLVKLAQPIPVNNVDGTANKAGLIMEVINLILCYKNHSKRTILAVSGLGKQKLILGHSWLQKHNPKINWVTGEVKMSRCPPCCCKGCRDEVCQE